MEGKKFLSPRGMVLCGALLLAAGALYLALSLLPQGTVAVVEQNGQEVARRELSQLAGPETLSLTGENGVEVTITFTPQGAAVTTSTCPDQVCVQTAHSGGGVRHLPARPCHPPAGGRRGLRGRHGLLKEAERMKQKAGRVAFTGLLAALAIALSFLEGLLPPLPMMPPGAKLGLSNLATMYAAGSLGLPSALFLAVFKGVFALVTRGGMAGLMSLSGGVVSTVVMWLLLKKANASLGVVGVCGALAHNAAQLCVAYFLTGTSVAFYVPFLVLFGVLTGLLTGLVLKLTLKPLERLQNILK